MANILSDSNNCLLKTQSQLMSFVVGMKVLNHKIAVSITRRVIKILQSSKIQVLFSDSELTFSPHVKRLIKSVFLSLRIVVV